VGFVISSKKICFTTKTFGPSAKKKPWSRPAMQVRSEGSFPGLVKDETFCPDKKAASFPEIFQHEEFFQAFGKVGGFEATIQLLDKFLLMDKILGYDGRDPACDFLFLWKFLYLGFLPSSFDEG